MENVGELGIVFEDARERLKRLCGGIEDVGFRGRCVLYENVSPGRYRAIATPSIQIVSRARQLRSRESYQSACVCSIDAEEGHGRLVRGAGRYRSVASSRGEAGNWRAGHTSPESGAKGTSGGHGG